MMKTLGTARHVLAAAATLGEGALWDHRRRRLCWVDIEGRHLHLFDPLTGRNDTHLLPTRVSTVVPRGEKGFVLGLERSVAGYDDVRHELEFSVEPHGLHPRSRLNDGKCDPAGRFWVGSVCEDPSPVGKAHLYVLHPEGKMEIKLDQVTISNGLAWSPDASRMYFIDTPRSSVDAFDYDLADGTIRARRVLTLIPQGMGFPDGMTVDSQGFLWVALWGGKGVLKIDPDSGEMLGLVDVPALNVTSCAFGGDDLQDLYITTAAAGTGDPMAGDLFVWRAPAPGLTAHAYAG